MVGLTRPDRVGQAKPTDGILSTVNRELHRIGWLRPGETIDGRYQIVQGLEISDFSRKGMQATLKELEEERDSIKDLLGK